ncbi:MAG: nicotinate-nucleotide adenylyltransferase [Planctomycetota bacterium]
MGRRMLLFGGTFDPVHHGHLIAARAICERGGYGRVVLVPAARPPHKAPAAASRAQRLAMLRLAAGDDATFVVDDIELRRDGPSYTYDTLAALRDAHDGVELHWVIGADMLEDLPEWHRVDDVLDMARIVVAVRPPWTERIEALLDRLRDELDPARVDRLAASVVQTPQIEISSREIRDRLARARSIRYLVPEPVRACIMQEGLYTDARGETGEK